MQTNLETWLQSQKLINKSELARASHIAPGDKAARTRLTEHLNGTKTNQVVQTKIRATLQQLVQELQTILGTESYTATDMETAFNAGQETTWEDLEQTTRTSRYDSYGEWRQAQPPSASK